MWPSLPTANHIADVANWFFIGSLVVGVVSTIMIVWMAGVKEAYWEKDRTESAERIATLGVQGDQLRKDTAEANERAAGLGLALEREIAARQPRRISGGKSDEMAAILSPLSGRSIAIVSRLFDTEAKDFGDDLDAVFKKANWNTFRDGSWTMYKKGVFIATLEGTLPIPKEIEAAILSALAANGTPAERLTIEANAASTMSPHFQNGVLYLLVGAKP